MLSPDDRGESTHKSSRQFLPKVLKKLPSIGQNLLGVSLGGLFSPQTHANPSKTEIQIPKYKTSRPANLDNGLAFVKNSEGSIKDSVDAKSNRLKKVRKLSSLFSEYQRLASDLIANS